MAAAMNLLRRCSHLITRPAYPRMIPWRGYSMDDDGDLSRYRTTVTVLNQEQDQGIFIDSYSCMGFLLNTGVRVIGPCAVFPKSVLHWNVQSILHVNADSLSLFTMLEPKIDILVLGVGERENMNKVDVNVIKYLRENKVNVEILPTDQALATFNFLNAEKRYVAGAFIPPTYVDSAGDEELHLMSAGEAARVARREKGVIDDDITPVMEAGREERERKRGERKPGDEY